MSSSSSLVKNAAVYSASNILNAVIPFLLLPVLTRVLTPGDYGVIAMFTSLLGILGAFTGFSVQGAVNVRYVDRDKIDYPRYVGSCLFILLISTVTTLVFVLLFKNSLSDFTDIPPFWLVLAVLVSGCTFLTQIRLGIWLMSKKPFVYGTFQASQSIFNIGLSLLFVLLLHKGYQGRLWGQTLSVMAFALAAIVSLRIDGWLNFKPCWKYIREGLAFGVPLVPHVIGAFLVSLADRFIINKLLGLEAAGIYMVAAQIGLGMTLFSDAFNKAFVPWIYESLVNPSKETKLKIVRLTWIYFGVALLFAGLVALLSHTIISIIAGVVYTEAAKPLIWLGLGQAFGGMYFMVANYIFYTRKTVLLSWITLLTGCVGVLLTWILVPKFGITGAGLSFAFAMCLRFLMTWYLANRVHPMPWFEAITDNLINK
ncbi:MAG: oligosaccharide flippase family protein [Desulfuromonadaceae bacterium]|nr:oligosaccharide flippase family protein [Desulfuromonadaceae bacterium]MDD2855503.1 oligosaccharide flippase family protein [Desulfuromonadaceae bacterium]